MRTLDTIRGRVREREAARRLLYSRMRKTGVDAYLGSAMAARVSPLLREYLETLMQSLIGFWIVAKVLSYIPHYNALYTFPLFGLLYSLQSSYHKYRLSVDPNFKIPKCRCAGRANDNAEVVLKDKHSSIAGIPYSAFGIVFYSLLLLSIGRNELRAALLVSAAAVVVSAYLSYVMVAKIRSLCTNCINVAALNVLSLLQFIH